MQCTAPHAPQSSVPLSVSPRSLAAAFAHVPDPRRHASVTYALAAILALAVAAILANQLSVLAIAEWGTPVPRVAAHPGLPPRAHTLSIDPAAPVQQT
jgi:hypothetical protein